MTGLVNRHTSYPLQLKASSIFAEVNGFAARVLATLTYYNQCEYDVEGLFVFPQDERTTVVELEATVEERHVYTDIRAQTGQKSTEKSVYSVEEREDDLFSLSIGRIPAHCSVFAQVTLLTELISDRKTRGSLFILPSVFTPRLSTDEDEQLDSHDLYGSQMLISDIPRKTLEPYSFELQLEVAAPCLLAGCSSPTHAIQVDADSKATNASRIHITIAEPHTYDCELVVLLHLSHPNDPYVLIEEGKKERVDSDEQDVEKSPVPTNLVEEFTKKPSIMINYTPSLTSSSQIAEFIFLVDRSGSMSGKHIFQVKEMLILFLKSLPANCYFNLIGFGSYYRSVYQETQIYDEETAEHACNYVQKMRADLGGTNLILPLEFIFNQPPKKGIPRFVFMLTDGGVSNTTEVIDFVRRNAYSTRFYTFGIGPEACPHLVQGVAGAGRGKAWFVCDEDRVSPKVMLALRDAMAPAMTDIEVNWHLPEGYDLIQTPSRLPFVLDGERLVIYGILSRPPWDEREPPRTPARRRMDCSMRSFSNNSVKVFWFDDDLEYLPDDELLLEMEEHDHLHDEERTRADSDVIGFVVTSNGNFGETTIRDVRGCAVESCREIETVSEVASGDFNNLGYDNSDDVFPSTEDSSEDQSRVSSDGGSIGRKGSPEPANGEPDTHNVTVIKATRRKPYQQRGRLPCQKRQVEGSPEKSPAGADEETADQEQAHQRDSGVGFSMDEGEKSASGDVTPTDDPLRVGTRIGVQGERPPLEGQGQASLEDEEEVLEDLEESKVSVFKGSPLLAHLGMPKTFGAVVIRGFVGDEQINRTIPFPVNHSGGSPKCPTIHQLMARSFIREQQISSDEKRLREVTRISKQAKMYCRLTSLVSIDQYCYDEEILCALQFYKKGGTPVPGRRGMSLLRNEGYATGLGRRLSMPEGSDQDEQWLTFSPGVDEEPFDFYRLDRTTTGDSSDDSPQKTPVSNPPHHYQPAGRSIPPLSSRYVVGEKQSAAGTSTKTLGGRISPIHMKCLKEYKPFVMLANLQSSSGNWELDESFADCLGLTVDAIKRASPLADADVDVGEELQGLLDKCDCSLQLWATAMALAWLCRSAAQFQEEWCLLARKADDWMNGRMCPRAFTPADLKRLAFQALLLLTRKSETGSSKPWDKTVALLPWKRPRLFNFFL
ncbi:von Willebrand factor A domain-containing protein 5B1 isoform X2 [Nematostella vectensis]|uniref:von Willebrand factor A domain-containing protein 5B1 isoform X2 n=1 Tax=Nematostella vectensis TaxID=45351 RepID=UPI002076ED84|nr:von Willebrand factor A domain-containing protein 5B1 isoform X2 [Nematostella vectensis]